MLILGTAMYCLEADQEPNHFSSIPKAVYWAIITVTTVGYGDITPTTPLGQALAAVTMSLGYSIIVVPTGIVTADIVAESAMSPRCCPNCSAEGHHLDAEYCHKCGAPLVAP